MVRKWQISAWLLVVLAALVLGHPALAVRDPKCDDLSPCPKCSGSCGLFCSFFEDQVNNGTVTCCNQVHPDSYCALADGNWSEWQCYELYDDYTDPPIQTVTCYP